ncbi:MAG: glycosyl hydrolase, repeat-containing protein, partial [Frankiales bacterium]|nr:glycosyl hydrolase, repeat-containing protein [Frankiales bacterium]
IRRRRRTQRLQVATSGLAVAALAFAASVVVNDHLGASQKPPTPAFQPAPDTAAVPPGFQAADVSYSGSTSWVLGAYPCTAGHCPLLLTSTDGGPWQRRNAPPAELRGGDGEFVGDCAATTCVSHVRFVGDVGYAYGPGLSLTLDGGRSWTNQEVQGQVLALEAGSRSVVRVVEPTGGCPCLGVRVERSTLDSPRWLPVHETHGVNLVSASLVRRGSRLIVLERGHTAGGAQDARSQVLISNDGGDTWVEHQDPCGPLSTTDEVDASEVALAADGVVVALCQHRNGSGSLIRVSTDSGRSYERARPLPSTASLLAAAGGAIVVAIDDGLPRRRLVRSTDQGRTWVTVATQSSDPRYSSEYLAFTSERLGTWIGGDRRRLVRTADSGATWKDQPLNR